MARLCLGAAEPQSGRDVINYTNNKQPDASPNATQLRCQGQGMQEGSERLKTQTSSQMRPVLPYSSYGPASWPSQGPGKVLHIFFRKEHNSEKPPVGEFSFQPDLDRPAYPP